MLSDLLSRFHDALPALKRGAYNETEVRVQFINPLFAALGWDMDDRHGRAEVKHEDKIAIAGKAKAPDYGFYLGCRRAVALSGSVAGRVPRAVGRYAAGGGSVLLWVRRVGLCQSAGHGPRRAAGGAALRRLVERVEPARPPGGARLELGYDRSPPLIRTTYLR